MLIADAIDALITCGWWLAGWILVGAAFATIVLLAGSAVGAWAVRGAWRGVVGALRAAQGLRAVRDAETAPRPPQGSYSPATARTRKEAA